MSGCAADPAAGRWTAGCSTAAGGSGHRERWPWCRRRGERARGGHRGRSRILVVRRPAVMRFPTPRPWRAAARASKSSLTSHRLRNYRVRFSWHGTATIRVSAAPFCSCSSSQPHTEHGVDARGCESLENRHRLARSVKRRIADHPSFFHPLVGQLHVDDMQRCQPAKADGDAPVASPVEHPQRIDTIPPTSPATLLLEPGRPPWPHRPAEARRRVRQL